MRISFIK